MRKSKTILDRKTRRAIARQMRACNDTVALVNNATSAAARTSYVTSSMSISGSLGVAGSFSTSGVQMQAPTYKILPMIEGDLYLTTREVSHDHLNVAIRYLGIDYTMVRRREVSGSIPKDQYAFYSKEDRDAFEKWMTDYLTKFSGYTSLRLPPPLDGHYPHTVKVNWVMLATDNDPMMTQWFWVLDNCAGEVRQTGDFFFFADEADATIFQLAFPA